MDLVALRAFIEVVETGSLLAAATNLNYARPTLRRRVDELEARAGVPLLTRTKRGVVATEAGAVLATRAREILREADLLLASVRELGSEPAGLLRVVAPVGLPSQLFAPFLGLVRMTYPKLALDIRFADDPIAGLIDNVDVAIHFGPRAPRGPWTRRTLVRAPERLLATRDYLARRGTPTKLTDLDDHELLTWRAPDRRPERWPLVGGGEIDVKPAIVSSDIHMIRECAAAGIGLAFVPDADLPIAAPSSSGLVHVLPLVGSERVCSVLVPTAVVDSPKIRAVLDIIDGFLAPPAPARAVSKSERRPTQAARRSRSAGAS